MIYIGYVVSVAEAQRLLGLNDTFAVSYYDTEPIQKYLKAKGNKLVFRYIDKAACLFGISCSSVNGDIERYNTIEQTIISILLAKQLFYDEIKKLGVDTSVVNLTWVEKEPWLVQNPEPYVITL